MVEKKPYQQSKDKLKGLPFSSIREMNNAEKQIALENWKRLTCYKDFSDQITKDEFEGVYQEFTTGFLCGYSGDDSEIEGDSSVMRVFKIKRGIQIKINEKRVDDPKLISSLASELAFAFGKLFHQMGGLSAPGGDIPEELSKTLK